MIKTTLIMLVMMITMMIMLIISFSGRNMIAAFVFAPPLPLTHPPCPLSFGT
jgi:hypothetical protein